MKTDLRLGINIDHVATIRNARGGKHPDPVNAARIAEQAGADGITAHLREDRRHITDNDIDRLIETLTVPLNFEMAATPEMLRIALRHKPHACCLVPEKREERTTEGGLDIVGGYENLKPYIETLNEAGARVSLFIEPDEQQLEAAKRIGAAVVELHTGAYCEAPKALRPKQFERIHKAATLTKSMGLECHSGHGLTFETVEAVAALPEVVELNIGHFLIGEAIFTGLEQAILKMRHLMDQARSAS